MEEDSTIAVTNAYIFFVSNHVKSVYITIHIIQIYSAITSGRVLDGELLYQSSRIFVYITIHIALPDNLSILLAVSKTTGG